MTHDDAVEAISSIVEQYNEIVLRVGKVTQYVAQDSSVLRLVNKFNISLVIGTKQQQQHIPTRKIKRLDNQRCNTGLNRTGSKQLIILSLFFLFLLSVYIFRLAYTKNFVYNKNAYHTQQSVISFFFFYDSLTTDRSLDNELSREEKHIV